MQQASQLENYYYQLDICIRCQTKAVEIMKWGLCNSCYHYLQHKSLLKGVGRTKFNIPYHKKHQQFCDTLRQKCGNGIFDDLEDLKTKPLLTLEDVSQKYPLTRERIRQIFKKYHGIAYTKYFRAKRDRYKEDNLNLNCSNNPLNKVVNYKKGSLKLRGAQGEKMALEKCNELGLDVQIPCGQVFDLYINGYEVDVKTAYTSARHYAKTPRQYYHFKVSKKQRSIGFLICIIFPYKQFFIIPQTAFIANTDILIPDERTISRRPNRKPSRFLKYKEAWHLLEIPMVKSSTRARV